MAKFIRTAFLSLIIAVFAAFLVSHPTFAATCSGVDTSIIECEGGGDAGIWAVLSLIVNILSILIGIVAVIGIAIFGIQYLKSGGDVAKVTKAKRRLLEIILGLVAYVLLWAFVQWLLPGGAFSRPSGVDSISIKLPKEEIYVGSSTNVIATIESSNSADKTYTLTSSDASIVTATANYIRCIRTGEATITATTSNNKTASTTVKCIPKETPIIRPDDTTISGNSSSSHRTSSGGYADNAAVKAAYDSANNVTAAQVDQMIKDELGITDTEVVWFAAAYEASPSWWIGQYNDYLFSYYGICTYLREVREHGAQGEINRFLSWNYNRSLISERAAAAKNDEMVIRMLYATLQNPRYDLGGFCGADDIEGTSIYGYTSAWPHELNSDGGDYRLNTSGQRIYAYIVE